MSGAAEITDYQQRRVAAIRLARTTEHITLGSLEAITKDRHTQLGIVHELLRAGLLKPAHVGKVLRWSWTPGAEFVLDVFEPRKGKHE